MPQSNLSLDMLSGHAASFTEVATNLRLAVRETLPGTDAQQQIEQLCGKLIANYQEVRSQCSSGRPPTIIVASSTATDRRWIVSALRNALRRTLNCSSDLVESETEGFGPERPSWFAQIGSFTTIEADEWSTNTPWTCLAIDPSKTERLDGDSVFYVVRFEDMQTDAVARSIKQFAGMPVIPVVLNVTTRGQADVRSFLDRLNTVLQPNTCLEALQYPDFQDKRTTDSVEIAENEIWMRCQTFIAASDAERSRVQDERCEAIERQLNVESQRILGNSELKELHAVLSQLENEERQILKKQTESWISGTGDLTVPIRMRMRLHACEITPPLCFPFRSILGALALTSGAWERVAMGLLGSPVGLALAAYQTGWQFWKNRNNLQELNEAAADQFSRTVGAKLIGVFKETQRKIRDTLPESEAIERLDQEDLKVVGADLLLREVRSILDEECRRLLPKKLVLFTAFLSTIFFIILVSGPIIALYADYVRPLFKIWTGENGGITSFPLPEVARIFTGFVLGLLPGAIAGMVLLTFVTRKQITQQSTVRVEERMHMRVDAMIKDDVLRLEGLDKSFAQLRLLNRFIDWD